MFGTVLIEWRTPDGRREVEVFECGRSLYSWREQERVEEEDFGTTYEYWRPAAGGGLYPSVLDARNDAAKALPWLSELLDGVATRPHS
ncbi:MAG: hypothetical protein ACOY45_01915 [Pseudomonadota bacterium]